MHCPRCGARIEADEISYCTRCGQMLDRIRVAMSDEAYVERGREISRAGLNLGVVLMYAGLWPALLAVILSPSALPLAFLLLSVALLAIIFGSGPLIRLFQTDQIPPEVERARRKEIAFSSTLMYLAAIIATVFVAVAIPDSWARLMIIGLVTGLFGLLLAASKPLYSAYRELASDKPSAILGPGPSPRELTTSTLKPVAVDLEMPKHDARVQAEAHLPHSVTEHTTRSLEERDEVDG
ncbi:MAG TPA: hypothetical protein VFZ23_14390 [Pyrinomonadaceae bacterium]